MCDRNVEDILAEKGETVTKLTQDDIIELVQHVKEKGEVNADGITSEIQ